MRDRASKRGALRPEPGSAPMGLAANVGRTETDFQRELRIVNGMLALWRHLAAGVTSRDVPTKQKGRREAGLS